MIQLVKEGRYKLTETRGQTKILKLDHKTYAWVNTSNIGEILVTSKKYHQTDNILAIGNYRIYDVKDEPALTDLKHLELFVGDGVWQGYLLTTGIPTKIDNKKRIIPTKEIITKSTT